MDGKEIAELRELVEFLKANDVAEFDMEREDLKVRLKFAGAATAGSTVDIAQLAQMMAASQAAAVPFSAGIAHAHPAQTIAAPPAQTTAASGKPEEAADPIEGAHIVKSPIVGTFYDAPAPDADTFVKVGDTVRSGQVLCIVEAMKLMNEIESDAAGEIIKVFAAAGQPVEYGQPLYAIKK